MSEFFLGCHVALHGHVVALRHLVIIRSVAICWQRNLDASTAPRTQFALPFTGHCGIESRLRPSLRGGTRLADRHILIDVHLGAGCIASLLLYALTRLMILAVEGRKLRLQRLARHLMIQLRWRILRHN